MKKTSTHISTEHHVFAEVPRRRLHRRPVSPSERGRHASHSPHGTRRPAPEPTARKSSTPESPPSPPETSLIAGPFLFAFCATTLVCYSSSTVEKSRPPTSSSSASESPAPEVPRSETKNILLNLKPNLEVKKLSLTRL